jgi:hypothetical protein
MVLSVEDAAFVDAEELLERLDLAEEALANLLRLGGCKEAELRRPEGWAAQVSVDGTALLLRADGERWSIYARADEEDAMLAARKLHGLIGEKSEGWDLDR